MIDEGTLRVFGFWIAAILILAYVIMTIFLPVYVAGISKRVKQINQKFDRIIEIFESRSGV